MWLQLVSIVAVTVGPAVAAAVPADSSAGDEQLARMGEQESFLIEGTWDGQPIDHSPARLTLESGENQVTVRIEAPYFNDLAPPGGKAGEAFFKLWDYEVVEAFFLNSEEKYLELEFGPHGQHLMLMLNGNRNAIK